MSLLSKAPILTTKNRRTLAAEGRELRSRIEAMGIPKMWGLAPADILKDTQAWQQKCDRAGLHQGAVYENLGADPEHTSATEVLLVIDEIILSLEPPGTVGG